VKVYYFCPETGVYQGEGFLDESDLDKVDGATTIAPPSYSRGEVPFFDISIQDWALHELQQNDGSGSRVSRI